MSSIEEVNFTADGQVLNQLSTQVSNHLFALGELLKNSYDAQATEIDVIFDFNKNILTVTDNGIGISRDDVSKLLHMGGSNKQYGKKFKFVVNDLEITRIVQGSKGLGLLSAFKFGNTVTWHSNTLKNSFSLTVDKNKVTNSHYLQQPSFRLNDTNLDSRGTRIEIELDPNDPEVNYCFKILSDLQNSNKLVQFFFQNNLKVTFNLINKDGNAVKGFPLETTKRAKLGSSENSDHNVR